MTDTPRTIAALQALFADNTSGDISAQDLRDFLVTVVNYLDGVLITPTDNTEVPLQIDVPDDSVMEGTKAFVVNPDTLNVDNGGNPFFALDSTSVEIIAPQGQGTVSMTESDGNGNLSFSANAGVSVAASDTNPAIFSGRWASGTSPDQLLGALMELQGKVSGVDGKIGDVKVTAGGYLVVARNSAPTDGSLAAGDLALWFDSTNGAAKLMLKGKSANGTVVTGNVALS